ncbi:MAG: radical SAM/SPASM domain-containing protein [Methanoregulaceae archaeon]
MQDTGKKPGSAETRTLSGEGNVPGNEPDYTRLLNRSIRTLLTDVLPLVLTRPALALFAVRTLFWQNRAAHVRTKALKGGIRVPPVLIFSVTSRCNLSCTGCYMRARGNAAEPDLTDNELHSIVSQAVDLGVSFMVFAGGEPLLRKDAIFRITDEFPQVVFAIFTNGLLVDENTAEAFVYRKNIVPVISFEGGQDETDIRRGSGTYGHLTRACSLLRKYGIFFGCSLTVTRSNCEGITGESFIREMLQKGARLVTFVEYVPLEKGTEDLVLTRNQRADLLRCLNDYPRKFPALFLGFPGDDAPYGGCLSAGRGFLHISPGGDLEACPAAPYSDTNLKRVPFQDALRSEYLARVRDEHGILTESEGGCALWANRSWTASLLK